MPYIFVAVFLAWLVFPIVSPNNPHIPGNQHHEQYKK